MESLIHGCPGSKGLRRFLTRCIHNTFICHTCQCSHVPKILRKQYQQQQQKVHVGLDAVPLVCTDKNHRVSVLVDGERKRPTFKPPRPRTICVQPNIGTVSRANLGETFGVTLAANLERRVKPSPGKNVRGVISVRYTGTVRVNTEINHTQRLVGRR